MDLGNIFDGWYLRWDDFYRRPHLYGIKVEQLGGI